MVRGCIWLVVFALLMLLSAGAAGEDGTEQPAVVPLDFGGSSATVDLSDEASGEILSVETGWSQPRAKAGDERVLAVVIDIDEGWHINPNPAQVVPIGDFQPVPTTLEVVEAPTDVILFESPIYPEPHAVTVQYPQPDSKLMSFEGRTVFYLKGKVTETASPGTYPIELELAYQACDEVNCLIPTQKTIRATLEVVAAGEPVGEPVNPQWFEDYTKAAGRVVFGVFGWQLGLDASSMLGMIGVLALAVFGGFLLNLTPCVLPVIPIKIMGLAQGAGSRLRTFVLGVIMCAGVIAFWMALGVLIAVLGEFEATNELFGMPAFTIGVGVFIAVMAVAMCGLFAIQLPRAVYMVNPNSETPQGSFLFGIMTAVLSTPCTAPFMGAALGWSTQQSMALALWTFFCIGFGMALPYLVLAAFPQLVSKVPRTGPASELLKQVMGLLMLAAAAYFVGTGLSGLLQSPPDPPSKLYWWPVAAFVAIAGCWLVWRTWQITGRRLPLAIFTAVGTMLIVGAVALGSNLTAKGPIDWVYYTPQRFEQELEEGNVIVLDFTAEWCLNCKTLEHTQLHQDKVVGLLAEQGVVPMKVDITGHNPQGRAKLKSAGRLTIPLLVVYAPDGSEVFKSDAYHAGEVVAAVNEARGERVAGRR